MPSMKEVTSSDFKKEVLDASLPTIVDFWASWCGPCMMMAPIFEKLSDSFRGKLNFTKVNVDENRELAVQYEIRSIPCLVMFGNGKEIARLIGYKAESQLKKEIDAALK